MGGSRCEDRHGLRHHQSIVEHLAPVTPVLYLASSTLFFLIIPKVGGGVGGEGGVA
jgi:hypothetical protein